MTHQIAFLGTGIMGAPMAANLIKAGFRAIVWNRTRSKTDSLAAQGARVADGPVDCVKGADYILSILDSGPVVREVFFDSGAADAMKRGAVFIDMASIPPKMAQEHASWLKERGVGHLDAPVSGGSFGAAEGSLAIMAGGEKADFDRTERDGVWKPMGRASYIGPAGSGQVAKLANQIMVAPAHMRLVNLKAWDAAKHVDQAKLSKTRMACGMVLPLATAVGLAVLFSWGNVTGVAEGIKWGLVVALASGLPVLWYNWFYGTAPIWIFAVDSTH